MNITGLNKAELLVILFEHTKPTNVIDVSDASKQTLSINKARELIKSRIRSGNDFYFDYIANRPLMIDLSDDVVNTELFNQFNGNNAAEEAIQQLRELNDGGFGFCAQT